MGLSVAETEQLRVGLLYDMWDIWCEARTTTRRDDLGISGGL
jgi:hypothetical protein